MRNNQFRTNFSFVSFNVKMSVLYNVMFLFAFTLCTPMHATEFNTQPSGITIKAKNETLRKVINVIEEKSNFVFIQTGLKSSDLNTKINIEVENKEIDKVLSLLLKGINVQFKVIGRQIILFKGNNKASSQSIKDYIQTLISVSGSVIDETGMPIGGATIQLKNNRKKWVVADFDGQFTMNDVPSGSVLVIASLGFVKQEILVDSSEELAIILKEDVQALEEVVVTSNYGTEQKKSNLVSSVYQVTTKDIEYLPQQRVDKMLEGLVPGLEYMPQSDDASSARPRHSVTIRGEASLAASNEPLWIIDGTPMFTGDKTNLIYGLQTSVSPLSYINPDDIKSITVLKDASATSLYGADGANGVILITTKQGAISKPQFNVSWRTSASQINNETRYKTLNSQQYMTLAKEAFVNAGNEESLFPFTDSENNRYSTTNTDWYDEFFGIGLTNQLNVSASGGTEKATYYISGSYYSDTKTLKGNEQQRISLRSRNTINLTDRLKIDVSLSGSFNTNTLFTPRDDYYENLPIISPYNEDGSFRMTYRTIDGRNPDGSLKWVESKFFNTIAEREQNDNNQNTFALQGNLKLSYDVTDDLSYTAQVGTDYQSSVEKRYKSMNNWSGKNINGDPTGYANWAHANFINWHVINRLNYSRRINEHAINAVAGLEIVSRKNTYVSSYGSGFANDNLRTVSSASYTTGSANERITKSASYLGQLSYTYDNRYNLVLNARKDGNSNFGKDVKWADFSSIGLSWNIHEEDFFYSDQINTLSLKGSYGSNGNSRIGRQESYGIYAINDKYQYHGVQGAGMSKGPNPNLSWETTRMTNIGLRLAMFNNRLDISPEIYRNKTVNLLSNLDVSRTTGNTRVYRNVGEIENKGIEVTVQSVNIMSDDFKWRSTVMASHNNNKLLKLYNSIPKNLGNIRWEEGRNVNTYYLVEWAGVDPRDGYPMWYDTQGNITKEYSVANRVANKKSSPDLFGSVINTFDYKNFNLRIMANYTIGGYAFSSFGRNVTSDGLNIMSENQSVNQLDRWSEPGDLALSPKPLWGVSTQSVRNSTRFLYHKTHIKLQNVSLGYSLNNEVAQSLGFKAVQFTLIGDNLLVWTPYDKKNWNSYKNNMSGFPMEQTISLGLNATF